MKISNLINPYTMKPTKLQPSLIDPAFMMSQGIGKNKKALTIEQEMLTDLIIQKNNFNTKRTDEDRED